MLVSKNGGHRQISKASEFHKDVRFSFEEFYVLYGNDVGDTIISRNLCPLPWDV